MMSWFCIACGLDAIGEVPSHSLCKECLKSREKLNEESRLSKLA